MPQTSTVAPVQVTVGLIVRNEAASIAATLHHLLQLDFDPAAAEIIIVDGASTDGTVDIVNRCIADHPGRRIRLIPETGPRGHGNARNLVLENAQGQYVAFTDADCHLPADWLRTLVRLLDSARRDDPHVVAAGGIRYPAPPRHWKERLLNDLLGSYLGSGGSAGFVLARSRFVDSIGNYNVIYLRSVAAAEKYLPIRFGEDFEFNRRLTSKGYKLLLSPDAKVYHHQDPSFRAFARQMASYGLGQARVWKLTGHVRLFAPLVALFFIVVAVGWVTAFFSTPLFLAYLAIPASYALVVLASSLALATRHRSPSLLLATLLFPMQHAAYAFGFLRGLFQPARQPPAAQASPNPPS
ncbi:MAG: glycosyltransferase [Gemmataceae bacterium]